MKNVSHKICQRLATTLGVAGIFLSVIFNNVAMAALDLEYDERIDMQGLYFWYDDPDRMAFSFNREITPKGDCFDIVNGYAFLAWYKGGMNKRNLMLSRMKIGTNRWKTIQFPHTNTIFTGTRNGKTYRGAGNSHKTAAVGISPVDGTIHLTFDMHNSSLNYIVSKKNIAFASDAQFKLSNFNSKRNFLRAGSPIRKITYPNFTTNAAGELAVDFRVGQTRGGDRVMAYYNGNVWSKLITMVKGDGSQPTEFNTYGQLANFHGTTYLHGAIRVARTPRLLNQGVYLARAGLRGNEPWANLDGEVLKLPIRNLDQMAKFRVAEPVDKDKEEKMGTGQSFVATESGAMHFSGAVRAKGIFHYFKKANSSQVSKGTGGPLVINFSEGGRVYGVNLAPNGTLTIQSTGEDESRWRTDFTYDRVALAAFKVKYYQGKVYIIGAEKVDSDKRHFRQLVVDLGVGNFEVKPTVYFSKPTGNLIVDQGYKLYTKVEAKAASGSISNVKMYIDGNFVRQENRAPYEWGHFDAARNPNELDGLAGGSYVLKAVATDSNGLSSSNSIVLKVKGGGGSSTSSSSSNSSSNSSSSSSSSSNSSSSSSGSSNNCHSYTSGRMELNLSSKTCLTFSFDLANKTIQLWDSDTNSSCDFRGTVNTPGGSGSINVNSNYVTSSSISGKTLSFAPSNGCKFIKVRAY